jgi:hypothetical protein
MATVAIRLVLGLIGATLVGRGIETVLASERGGRMLRRAGFGDLTSESGLELASKYGRAVFAVVFGAWAMLEEADEKSGETSRASPWPTRVQRASALLFVLASVAETVSEFIDERHSSLLPGRRAA